MLWDNVAQELSNSLEKGSIIVVKGAKVSRNDFHGVSINVSDGAKVLIDPQNIKESNLLKLWYSKKKYSIKCDLWCNLLVVFDEEKSVNIDHMLDKMYNSHEKYTKNLLAYVFKCNIDKILSCPEKNCLGSKLQVKSNKYICLNCGNHVKPREYSMVNVTVGDESRSLFSRYMIN